MPGIIESIFQVFQGIINSILAVFQHIFSLVEGLISQIVHLFTSLISFIMHNIVIIGIAAAAFVGYAIFVQQKPGAANRTKANIKKKM